MLRHDLAGPRIQSRRDIDRPQIAVVDILQRHGHDFALAIDIDTAEELQSKARGEVFALLRAAALRIHRLGPNVLSSSPGAQVPACNGPETQSKNCSNT